MLRARSNNSALGMVVRVAHSKKTVICGVLQLAGTGLSICVGEVFVKRLRHEYRYKADEPHL
ncbi:hypothetical protein GCM10009688_24630 [Arthrobacter gandavensis]|uniref:Uncharacterized protein n=1 Tax=Arthrobacter gandavensis TaxID=169960 RepID=A0ABP5ARS7_9MICC